jgi:methyl-accepting chemotaxis protein
MKLRIKFNLVLGLAGLVGISCSALFSHYLVQANAREEVLNTARIMMESAIAVRKYTINEIKPLLAAQEKHKFLPQSVPAYSANRYVSELQKNNPDYSYKEAMLNPTNLSNRATDWEADVVTWFKNHATEKEFIGERDSATGPVLYMGKPIKITNPDCLACHSTPAQAPKTLVAAYGDTNGFGWKMDEIIGAQIVSVPMSLPLQRAETTFYSFLIAITSVFVVIGILLNILLHFIVIKPMINIAKQADRVSMGELDIAELNVKGNDEIASVGQSFNRMHRSLINAFSMLDDNDANN